MPAAASSTGERCSAGGDVEVAGVSARHAVAASPCVAPASPRVQSFADKPLPNRVDVEPVRERHRSRAAGKSSWRA